MGVFADGAEPARVRRGPPGDAQGHRGLGPLHDPRRARAAAGGVSVPCVGHRPGDDRAARRRAARGPSGAGEGRRLGAGGGDHQSRRLVGAASARGARRLGVRVRQRRLPGRRRHRRGGARAEPRRASGRPRRHPPGRRLAGRHGLQGRRLRRLRRRQHAHAGAQAAVLRLRGGHRPADRRRHGAHAGGVRGPRARELAGVAARLGVAGEGAGERRLVVRALGRQPCLRHRRRGPGDGRRRRRSRGRDDPPGGSLAGGAPERRRRVGRGPALLP